ncbi:leucyl aminopeptidase family protein [Psychrobacillus sp. FSL H8-0483]|uniref:leucyl aminopeptidase family protein n=1 Tax=Psychrobacillus sp. FSL H8-0483 TaxID=2921389 RepID=UPI003159FBEA
MLITVGSERTTEATIHLCWKTSEPIVIAGVELKPHMRERGAAHLLYGRGTESHHLVIGLGEVAGISYEILRNAAGVAARTVQKEGFQTVAVHLEALNIIEEIKENENITSWTEGWLLGSYQFDRYKSKKKVFPLEKLHIISTSTDGEVAVQKGIIRAEGTMLARDLCNEPPNILHPESLVEFVETHFAELPVDIHIYREEELVKQQMNGLLTVGQGSSYKPAMIELSYATDPKQPLIVLVGKGITFDMGGMNVKSGRDISDARFDMGGACAVLGAMGIISRSGIQANITALIATADNMPDSRAFVPSTVITYPNGLTVQVGNTDAEGRLVLADALLLANRLGAKEVVDICTLTGNVGEALGLGIAGVWGDQSFVEEFASIGEQNGDRVWPMPLIDEYEELLHSDYADMNNMSSIPYGGAIVAALFLRRFVDPSIRWAHIDMANTVQSKGDKGYYTAGATGYGTRLLVDFVLSRQEEFFK